MFILVSIKNLSKSSFSKAASSIEIDIKPPFPKFLEIDSTNFLYYGLLL